MNKHVRTINNDVSTLVEDARALVTATADVAGEKVAEARERLTAALGQMRDKAIERAKAADEAMREHPYHAAGIGLGLGVLIGYLIARR